MKKGGFFIIAIIAIAFLTNNLNAAQATFNIHLRLLKQLEVVAQQDLNFGSHEAGFDADVTVAPSNTQTDLPSDAQAGIIYITGEAGRSVTITFGSDTVDLINQDDGTSTISVDAFSLSNANPTLEDNGQEGEATIYIGATAHITASAPAGQYDGTNTVTVVYDF